MKYTINKKIAINTRYIAVGLGTINFASLFCIRSIYFLNAIWRPRFDSVVRILNDDVIIQLQSSRKN